MTDISRVELKCDRCGATALGAPRATGPQGWLETKAVMLGMGAPTYLPLAHLCPSCKPALLIALGMKETR